MKHLPHKSVSRSHLRRSTSVPVIRGAHADKFKTPGSHPPVIRGDNNQALIIDAETPAELVRLRREALEAMNPPQAIKSPFGDLLDAIG